MSSPPAKNPLPGGSPAKYNVDDLVLAKVKGYPHWPGIIVDESNVPKAVVKERRSKDHYIIRFFPAADYHFATARDLSLLTPKQIEDYLKDPSKKGAELKNAYKCAGSDPLTWNEEQNDIVRNHENALSLAAEEEQENEDQLMDEGDDDDDDDEKESAPKKRKREDHGGKVRQSATSEKRKKPKTSEAKPVKAEAAKAPTSGRKATNGEAEGEEELDPETKKVKDWRHKLQRAFIPSKEGALNAEDMPQHDETFKLVEAYEDMTFDQLRNTKIAKVMKRIMQLDDIPRDEEFQFKKRAEALFAKWQAISKAADGPGQDGPAPIKKSEDDKPKPDTAVDPSTDA